MGHRRWIPLLSHALAHDDSTTTTLLAERRESLSTPACSRFEGGVGLRDQVAYTSVSVLAGLLHGLHRKLAIPFLLFVLPRKRRFPRIVRQLGSCIHADKMKLWKKKIQQSERQPGILLPPFKTFTLTGAVLLLGWYFGAFWRSRVPPRVRTCMCSFLGIITFFSSVFSSSTHYRCVQHRKANRMALIGGLPCMQVKHRGRERWSLQCPVAFFMTSQRCRSLHQPRVTVAMYRTTPASWAQGIPHPSGRGASFVFEPGEGASVLASPCRITIASAAAIL